MEQKTLKKVLQETGKNGTFKGLVEVIFNYRSEMVKSHNRITHDDEMVERNYHLVQSWYEGVKDQSKEVHTEREVKDLVYRFENFIIDRLKALANTEKHITVIDQLKIDGYE